MAVIFGEETKKLLYIGVRINCVAFVGGLKTMGKPDQDVCFTNWKDSSQAMEADIILSGFLEAESSHGVRYINIIADGDSSVYSTLLENVPVWGKDIKTLECANHICKCIRSSLENLVEEKPNYKGKGKLTKINRIRLSTAIRCAIKMRSESKDHRQLRKIVLTLSVTSLVFTVIAVTFVNNVHSQRMKKQMKTQVKATLVIILLILYLKNK